MSRFVAIVLSVLVGFAPAASVVAPVCESGCGGGLGERVGVVDSSAAGSGDCCEVGGWLASGGLEWEAGERCPPAGPSGHPGEEGCDCGVACACIAKTVADRPVSERVLWSRVDVEGLASDGSSAPAGAGHLDRLKRPPRSMTAA